MLLRLSMFLLVMTTAFAAKLDIVPLPNEIQIQKGYFQLGTKTKLLISQRNKAAQKAAKFLQDEFKKSGWKLKRTNSSGKGLFNLSRLLLRKKFLKMVSPNKVTIDAQTYGGYFYAVQSFIQLLPAPNKELTRKLKGAKIPCLAIKDQPRMNWRSMMLDCSRQFFSVEDVKKYIDVMATYKINVFHWHLTDDEGWRFESKKYPLLTQKGAWRGPSEVLPHSRGSKRFGDKKYGGFYSQKEIKEIVRYALDRNINILPEIDVPGHCQAVGATYPKILCEGDSNSKSVQGVRKNTFCAGREENFKMLDEIFGEVAALFPFDYIHIGGDEVNKGPWSKCPKCKTRLQNESLNNVGQLQNYFIRRVEKIIRKHQKRMIGWNEILHGGKLETDTTIMSWTGTGPGIHAAKHGHNVIMTPGPYTYFDMAQAPGERGHWWAGVVPTEKVYNYDPHAGIDLAEEKMNLIFGIGGCLWSEFLDEKDYFWYQTYPRLLALAEVAWTKPELKNWQDFMRRVGHKQLPILDAKKIPYRVPTPKAYIKDGLVKIDLPYAKAKVYYTLDGSEPTKASQLYLKSFKKEAHQELKMRLVTRNGRSSAISKKIEDLPIGIWNPNLLNKKNNTVSFKASLPKKGKYVLRFNHSNGEEFVVEKVEVLYKGKLITSQEKTEKVTKKNKSASYSFKLAKALKSSYQIRVSYKTPRGTDSFGSLYCSLKDTVEVPCLVSSNKTAQKGKPLSNAADWNPTSHAWINSQMNKGDHVTFTFDKAVKLSYVESRTGFPNTTRDILTGAELQYSLDGKTYIKVADYTYGTAKGKLPNKKIKSFRILVQEKQEFWALIQDLILKK